MEQIMKNLEDPELREALQILEDRDKAEQDELTKAKRFTFEPRVPVMAEADRKHHKPRAINRAIQHGVRTALRPR